MIVVLGWFAGVCFLADVLFPPCLAIYALLRWSGRWRIAAAVPLAVTIPGTVFFLKSQGSTSPARLLYVALSLVLCAYSGILLMKYLNRKPPEG